MRGDKIKTFMELAGQRLSETPYHGNESERKLGAQLLLSEVLEYVIKGLGVIPEVDGVKITNPDSLHYLTSTNQPDTLQMLDGLADVAYTMYWNANAFGMPIEEAFEEVCDNNLEKFVALDNWTRGEILLNKDEWDCGLDVSWPSEVASVQIMNVGGQFFAVGKDARGKVRKPSTYSSVDLSKLL